MVIDILTLSPGYFASPLQEGMIRRGIEKGLVRVRIFNLREFTLDRHRTVDDRPFGGGPGMVLKPEPIVRALTFLQGIPPGRPYSILLTPRGRPLDQGLLKKIAAQGRLVLICGRYEGVDERVGAYYCQDQISIGDYVLSGGEPAALVMLDGVVRLIPEVLGSPESIDQESYEDHLLEYPQYTRPGNFENHQVPDNAFNREPCADSPLATRRIAGRDHGRPAGTDRKAPLNSGGFGISGLSPRGPRQEAGPPETEALIYL